MKKTVLLALVVLLCFTGLAQAQSDQRLKAAENLLEAMNVKVALQKSIDAMLDVQLRQRPAMRPYKDILLKFYRKYMSYESLKDDMVQIYADAFSEKELNEIAKFYRSPVGQKTIEKMPELLAKGAKLGIERVRKNLPELRSMIAKEAKRIEKTQKSEEKGAKQQ